MRFLARSLPTLVAALLAAAPLSVDASAQLCPDAGHTHYQNDVLPQVPAGPLNVAIIQGLCEGEACASIFTLQSAGPEKLTQVACPFTGPTGVSTGATATVNLVVFDNVTLNSSGVPTMTKVFDLNADTGNSLQIFDGGLNTFDVSNFNITVTGPKFAVGFIMNINPNGQCATGFQTNFFTDNTPCSPGTSLMFIQGQGWVDASKATVLGFPLCLFNYYNGDWVIRCCTEPLGNPLNVSVVGSPALPGQFVFLTFNAPGFEGDIYVAAASGSTTTGIPLAPHGVFPLDFDPLVNLSVFAGGGGIFNNFIGQIGPLGTAPGLITLPGSAPPGAEFWVAFVAFDPLDPAAPWGISSASKVEIL